MLQRNIVNFIRQQRVSVSLLLALSTMQAVAQALPDSLKSAPPPRGVLVHIGTTDGRVETDLALAGKGNTLVQGVTTSKDAFAAAQRHSLASNQAGLATFVLTPNFTTLPYNDHVVNCAVADLDLPGAPTLDEVQRIVRPLGIVHVKQKQQWRTIIKPMPKEMDDWTHYDRGADGNPQSRDTLVAAPKGLQWFTGNGGGFATSNARLSDGRYFESSRISGPMLTSSFMWAHDAFNGHVLWRIEDKTDRGPNERMLVATDNIITGIIGAPGFARVLDAATGEEKLVLKEGLEQPAKLRFPSATDTHRFVPLQQIVLDGRIFQSFEEKAVGLDLATGKRLWTYTAPAKEYVAYIIGAEGQIFLGLSKVPVRPQIAYGNQFSNLSAVVALDAATGKQLWSTEITDPKDNTFACFGLCYYKGSIYTVDGGHKPHPQKTGMFGVGPYGDLVRLDAKTGAIVFRTDISKADPKDISWHQKLRIQNDWIIAAFSNDVRTFSLKDGSEGPNLYTKPRNLGGDTLLFCSLPRGVPNGQLSGKFARFADFRDGSYSGVSIGRGSCNEGQYPGYGLIYTGADGCGCTAFLRGTMALQCTQNTAEVKLPDAQRLVTATPAALNAADNPENWTTFLGNAERSASSRGKPLNFKPGKLAIDRTLTIPVFKPGGTFGVEWAEDNLRCGPITPPVVADGRVFVAVTDTHTLYAHDAATFKPLWKFQTSGRITSSPTYYRGYLFFGSHDGYVTCLNAADGALAWRFLAAPNHRQIVVSGQLESLWPVHGAVVVRNDQVFLTAGRQNQIDGGIFVYRLNARTGAPEASAVINDQSTSEDKTNLSFWDEQGRTNDVLCANATGEQLFMGSIMIDPKTLAWANLSLIPKSKLLSGKGNNPWAKGEYFFSNGPKINWDTPGLISFIYASSTGSVDRRVTYSGQKGLNGYRFMNHKNYQPGTVAGERIARDGKDVYVVFNNDVYHRAMRDDWLTADGYAATLADIKATKMRKLAFAGSGVAALAVAPDAVLVACNEYRSRDFRVRVLTREGEALGDLKFNAPITLHSLAIADGIVYVALDDGRIVTLTMN